MDHYSLVELPSELIANVVAHLSDRDVFDIRLVNRHVERSCFTHFGKRFFRNKGYLITSPSLDVLRSISQHEELRKYVQHIWFNPDCYTRAPPAFVPAAAEDEEAQDEDAVHFHNPDGKRCKSLTGDVMYQYLAYRECTNDHAALLAHSGEQLGRFLSSILPDLPNLAVIGMRRSQDHCPWGWRALADAVGKDPRIIGPTPSGPMFGLSDTTRLFPAIISSLASTGVHITRLYTDAIEIDNTLPDTLSQAMLDKACGSIKSLELNASRAWLVYRSSYNAIKDMAESVDGLMRLLKATTKLQELGLHIFTDRIQTRMVIQEPWTSENWRESYPYVCLEKIAANVELPHLTRLKLEKATTTSRTLIAFLTPMQHTLASLKLRDMRLLSSPNQARPWEPVFVFLRDHCPKLDFLLLYHLMYESGGVTFVKDPPISRPLSPTDSPIDAPNQPISEPVFTVYGHVALEVNGRERVKAKVVDLVDMHWYHNPIWSNAMDEGLWHTDTSDEEE